eukprot:2931368-Pyramimonas_sp.AAC.1
MHFFDTLSSYGLPTGAQEVRAGCAREEAVGALVAAWSKAKGFSAKAVTAALSQDSATRIECNVEGISVDYSAMVRFLNMVDGLSIGPSILSVMSNAIGKGDSK